MIKDVLLHYYLWWKSWSGGGNPIEHIFCNIKQTANYLREEKNFFL